MRALREPIVADFFFSRLYYSVSALGIIIGGTEREREEGFLMRGLFSACFDAIAVIIWTRHIRGMFMLDRTANERLELYYNAPTL